MEAVLFGHVKGAFTGATNSQSGKFEEANGGTILLDEIGEMSPAVQAKLLRVLQEREVERVGSHKAIQLDIRVIAATNKDLREEVQKGTFREDLYYRLDVLPLHWPPLRERKEDILPISQFFIGKYQDGSRCHLSQDAIAALSQYHWPGNIRELENVIQRALVMRHGDYITAHDLMLPIELLTPVPCTEPTSSLVMLKRRSKLSSSSSSINYVSLVETEPKPQMPWVCLPERYVTSLQQCANTVLIYSRRLARLPKRRNVDGKSTYQCGLSRAINAVENGGDANACSAARICSEC